MLGVHNLRLQMRNLSRLVCKQHLSLGSSFSSEDSTTIDLLTFHRFFLSLPATKLRLDIGFTSTRRCVDISDAGSLLDLAEGNYTLCIDQGCCS